MTISQPPFNASNSIIVRLKIDNKVGMLASVNRVISEMGGVVGAIDLVGVASRAVGAAAARHLLEGGQPDGDQPAAADGPAPPGLRHGGCRTGVDGDQPVVLGRHQ